MFDCVAFCYVLLDNSLYLFPYGFPPCLQGLDCLSIIVVSGVVVYMICDCVVFVYVFHCGYFVCMFSVWFIVVSVFVCLCVAVFFFPCLQMFGSLLHVWMFCIVL